VTRKLSRLCGFSCAASVMDHFFRHFAFVTSAYGLENLLLHRIAAVNSLIALIFVLTSLYFYNSFDTANFSFQLFMPKAS
jgi:hypothetical protein